MSDHWARHQLLDVPGIVARWTLALLSEHQLGRKRILDTALVATLRANGVNCLATRNVADFRLFGIDVVDPTSAGAKVNG